MKEDTRHEPPHKECKCQECPFAEDKAPRHRPVLATIPNEVKSIIIGESPGDVEVDIGRPFVGPTGNALRDEGVNIGIEWNRVALINAIACKPTPESGDAEYKKAVECCRPFFTSNLHSCRTAKVRPLKQYTLVAGKYASLAFTGKKQSIKNKRGFIRVTQDGHPYVLTWHPTHALFYDQWRRGEFLVDLARWWGLATGSVKQLRPSVNLLMSPKEVFNHARKMGYVAFDIETTFAGPLDCTIKLLGFGWQGLGVSYKLSELTGKELSILSELTCSDHIIKVLMNGHWFDIPATNRQGFTFNNVMDIRDMRKAMVPQSQLSLSYQASIYLDMHPWKEDNEDDDDEKGMVETDDLDALMKYNATDCIVTSLIWKKLQAEPEWKEDRVQKLYRVHSRLSQIAAEMYQHGFMVDEPNRVALDKKLTDLHNGRKSHLIQKVKIKGWEGTPDQMRALIFTRHKEKGIRNFGVQDPQDPNMYTNEDMKTCSVDKDSLINLMVDPVVPDELKDIIELYWHYHAPEKARMTFVSSEKVLNAIGSDGRLRPEWNSCGTETMRWSCRRPNIMNLSEKKDEDSLTGELPNIRSMYRAAPGYVLVHADWSQQEVRIQEAASGDEELTKALAQPAGFYNSLAIKWFGLPPDANPKKENKGMYKITKNTYLGSQYAAGFPTVFRQLLKADRSVKWSQTKLIWEHGFNRTFLGIRKYWAEEQEKVNRLGYSEGFILKGRLVYPAPPDLSKLVNFPIQRTAGEMKSLAMIKIVDELVNKRLDAHLVTDLHDAMDVEVKKSQKDEVIEIMTRIMEGPWEVNGRVRKFPVEVKVGTHWSDV